MNNNYIPNIHLCANKLEIMKNRNKMVKTLSLIDKEKINCPIMDQR